jgi:hypothetical protein
MTEGEGKIIISALHQLRGLHRDVSLLLRTAEAAMTEKGWENGGNGSSALHEFSYSLDKPDQWMPWEIFRFYKHRDHPTRLASIAVLLDDFAGRLSEPVVTGAIFAFESPEKVAYLNWFATIFKAVPGREADGSVLELSRAELEQDWQSHFEKAWSFAYPLVSIRSETELRQKVSDHLHSLV